MGKNRNGNRPPKGWIDRDEDYDEYSDETNVNEYATSELMRGLGNWLAGKCWKTCSLPSIVVNRGTDRFGLYHEFDWQSVTLPSTCLAGNLRMHVHLGHRGNNVIAGAIWVVGHTGSALKSHEFHELDNLATWLSQKFVGVWFGAK